MAIRIKAAKKKETVELELEAGKVLVYELREMTGEESDAYGAFLSARMTKGADDDGKGVKADLIHRCLFDPATGKQVPMDQILEFSSTVQNALHMECNELNGYTVDSIDKAKKRAEQEKKS